MCNVNNENQETTLTGGIDLPNQEKNQNARWKEKNINT